MKLYVCDFNLKVYIVKKKLLACHMQYSEDLWDELIQFVGFGLLMQLQTRHQEHQGILACRLRITIKNSKWNV